MVRCKPVPQRPTGISYSLSLFPYILMEGVDRFLGFFERRARPPSSLNFPAAINSR
jgi:hypothetical protein